MCQISQSIEVPSGADLIVITSAGGQQAAHLLPLLSKEKRFRLRLVVATETSKLRLETAYPAAEVLTADLVDPSEAARVLNGVAVVYHIGPTFHQFEIQIGYNMVNAALSESGLKHFVYSAVIHTQIRKLLNHDAKGKVEEFLIESGLQFTILKPTHFIDMFPVETLLHSMEKDTVLRWFWDPKVRFSFIALSDLGLAAYKVIWEGEKHFYASYELCSTGLMSHTEQAEITGKIIQKKVKVETVPLPEAVDGILKFKFAEPVSPYTRDAAERLFLYYNRRGLPGNTNVLKWLIGQEPMDFQTWMEQEIGNHTE